MRALRYHGPYDIRLEHDIPEPECQPHQVKIRPSYNGICGSDLHAYTSPTAIPYKDTPHPLTGERWPVTLGHEFSGEIVEIGSAVDDSSGTGTPLKLQVGDRVTVQPTICCRRCAPCAEGLTNCCHSFGFVGLTGWGGGMSDFVCVDARFVFKLPDNVPLHIGALVEPLAVAWHAVEQSGVKETDSALVMGAGPIGLAVIQCLRARGTKQIIAVEMAAGRKDFAWEFGAHVIIDPRDEDVVSRCKALCGDGQGPEVAFDCAGAPASIKSACLAVRHRGLVVNLALWDDEVPFDFMHVTFGEKRITASISFTSADFKSVIEALGNGSLRVDKMVTRTIAMDRVVEDGFSALLNDKDKNVKILVDVRGQEHKS